MVKGKNKFPNKTRPKRIRDKRKACMRHSLDDMSNQLYDSNNGQEQPSRIPKISLRMRKHINIFQNKVLNIGGKYLELKSTMSIWIKTFINKKGWTTIIQKPIYNLHFHSLHIWGDVKFLKDMEIDRQVLCNYYDDFSKLGFRAAWHV